MSAGNKAFPPRESGISISSSAKKKEFGTRSRCQDDSRGVTLTFSIPSSDHRVKTGQPPPAPPHLCIRYGAGRRQPASPHAVDGTRANPDGAGLCACHSSRGLSPVRASCGATNQACAGHDVVKLSRCAPLEHPFAYRFQRAVESLTAALAPNSAHQYRGVARYFLIYLGEEYPAVCSLNQLRRDPHILAWFTHLHRIPALGAGRLSRLNTYCLSGHTQYVNGIA